jgi:hypothetical protein
MQCEYFDSPESLRHMMLHAAPDAARGRGLYALHLPADGRCLVRPQPRTGRCLPAGCWLGDWAGRQGHYAIMLWQCLFTRRAESSGLPNHSMIYRFCCFHCVQVWVVNPARRGQQELAAATLEAKWAEAAADAAAEGDADAASLPPMERPAFEVAYVRSQEAALKQLQRELRRIRCAAVQPAATSATRLGSLTSPASIPDVTTRSAQTRGSFWMACLRLRP